MANANFATNRSALSIEQSWIAFEDQEPTVTWVIGRDGSLTARVETADGTRWLADCSLPTRAADAMLKTAQLTSPVTCFLAPFHAAALRCTLDRLESEQAIIAIVPNESDLAIFLHCDDFAPEIRAHRLWFVTGEQWAGQLKQLLEQQIGLAVPSQFLRLNVTDDSLIRQLIEQAQIVFTSITATRSESVQAMQLEVIAPHARRLCVMTPMRFRLWQDEGFVLSHAAPEDAIRVDTSDPAQGSPLKLARSAIDAGSLCTPNLARADLPNVVPTTIPWFTWVTNDRVPAFDAAGPKDRLLVVDPLIHQAACAAGWPKDRVHAAAWPAAPQRAKASNSHLTVLADTGTLEPSKELDKFSSHRVLWETIRREIADDPTTVLTLGVRDYLEQRLEHFSISAESFPFDSFVKQLIVPAYGQAIVDTMLAQKVNIRLFGDGWSDIGRFKAFFQGTLPTRKTLRNAIDSSQALLHVWPTLHAHPIDSLGLPVLRATDRRLPPRAPAGDRASISQALIEALNASF